MGKHRHRAEHFIEDLFPSNPANTDWHVGKPGTAGMRRIAGVCQTFRAMCLLTHGVNVADRDRALSALSSPAHHDELGTLARISASGAPSGK